MSKSIPATEDKPKMRPIVPREIPDFCMTIGARYMIIPSKITKNKTIKATINNTFLETDE
jgi:hypothetical protein